MSQKSIHRIGKSNAIVSWLCNIMQYHFIAILTLQENLLCMELICQSTKVIQYRPTALVLVLLLYLP